MQAHLLVHFEKDLPKPKFPFLGLTVSGGHTQLVIVRNVDDMEIIGETLDDAVGEAFDKAGKMLGLPYPSGPAIDRLAREGKACVEFAKPSVSALNFSFSGLKTSILYHLRDKHQEDDKYIKKNLNDLCASIQSTIISIVMEKLELAVQQTGITEVALGGGVSANSGLRNALMNKKKWNIYLPPLSLTTDNAAMIALAGSFKYENGNYGQLDSHAQSRMPL